MDTHTNQHKRQRSGDSSTDAKRVKHDGGVRNGLADLPEEVLLLILDTILGALLRCHDLEVVLRHVAALHSLGLTNRKFNRLTTPYLCAFITNRNRRRLPQALDTMIMDLNKAESIKYISWVLDVRRSSQAMCRRSPKAETMYLQKLGKLGIPELAGDLRQCFHGNSPEYHLATALVLAPNLEYLEAADVNYEQETVDDTTWRPTWLELLALKALSSPPGLARHFQNLHHLQLSMAELSFEQIGPLLRLPALKTLHLSGGQHDGQIEAQLWDEEVGHRCSTVETLIFESCVVSSQIVAQMLHAVQHLKVLKLEINYWTSSLLGDENPDGQQHSWAKLSEAISEHKESLERLYLVDGGTDPRSQLEDWSLGYELMECLQDLPNLRYLDTGFMPFPTESMPRRASLHQMLLPSLEHLILKSEAALTYSPDAFPKSLEDLATDCRSRLPLLRDIVVWLSMKRRPMEKRGIWTNFSARTNFSACRKTFAGQGVHLVVLCYDDGDSEYESSDEELRRNSTWRLHPSLAEGALGEPLTLGGGSWGCQLARETDDRASDDGRAHVVFHGPCSAYHDPSGWSIIDNLQKAS
jgi:hypothetical protein